ncbi:MAG TPA: flagellar hook-basal body complex protein [Clostridia bacterium]|nr:flagellar hook-basal body complex protein [Clostridia bacterium]
MIRGLYISASAAVSESKRIDVIANNVANVNTTGYKKDVMLTQNFPEILISKINSRLDRDIMGGGPAGTGIESGNSGDVYTATTPSGYFNVETPLGVSKSRSIGFKVNEEGFLVTPQGNYILGQNGRISTGGEAVTVDGAGRVLAGGTAVDTLKVTKPLNVLGHLSYGIHSSEVATNYEQGQLQPTGNSFDLALKGKGFFSIETPAGERYTRNGEFTRDAEGYMVTKEGWKVLGEAGYIKVDSGNLLVKENGEVYKDEQLVDKLKLVDFDDYKILRKEENGMVRIEEGIEEGPVTAGVSVQQGSLEGSNVNSVKEMVEMMTMMRTYEANQRLITIHDGLLEKAVNNIARV